jgi:hypothetical protein
MTTTLRRGLTALCTILIMLVCAVVAAAAPATPTSPGATLTNIRTGQNTGFDRVVLDLNGPAPSTHFQQVDELIADGSGEIVWLTGAYFVSATAFPATAAGTYTGPQKFRTRNLRNVMAVAITGDFEGYLSVGIGTRTQPSYVHVFTLTAPTRVVIDIGN